LNYQNQEFLIGKSLIYKQLNSSKMIKRTYDLEDRLIDFVLKIDQIVELLPNTRLANHLAGQLIRSGTSPALNYGEVQSAESQKDFIHKIQVVLKELRETRVCLKIIIRKPLVEAQIVSPVLSENEELIAIFAKSSQTAKSKLPK
jgi:four helix bundle protein